MGATEECQETDVSALCLDVSRSTPFVSETQNQGNESNSRDPGGWTPLLVLGGATCCLGSAVPAGFNIGVMNNPAYLMQAFCNQSVQERYGTRLSNDQLMILWSAIVSIFLVGGVTGSLLAGWLGDKLGRKGALAIGNVCGTVGACMFLLVPQLNSIEIFLAGRLLVGLSGGLATSLLPMYMTEVAPLKLRGAVGVLCQLGITVGVFLGQIAGLESVLGTNDTWHIMLACFSPLCVLALVLTFVLPESPKYLYITKQQHGKALKELSRLRDMDIMLLHNEVANLQKESAMSATADPWTIKRVLNEPSVRLPLFLVCIMQLGQQLSGINAVFYYSSSIFLDAGLGISGSQYATLGTGIANIVMALVSVLVMSYCNRRIVMLVSCYLCIACLSILCVSIALTDIVGFMPYLSITTVLAYVVFYGIGLGPIPYFIGSELFDVGPRPAAMALGSVFNWGGNFIVGMAFPTVAGLIRSFTFLIFAGCTALLVQIIRVFLPETRGKTTTETAMKMTEGFKSRPN